jgi:hypothetical protein
VYIGAGHRKNAPIQLMALAETVCTIAAVSLDSFDVVSAFGQVKISAHASKVYGGTIERILYRFQDFKVLLVKTRQFTFHALRLIMLSTT